MPMAKDTEKLIRQLSLIAYLMAERRPVTALEIRANVEGYSGMNEDAFARRFYADRAELESLGIALAVDRPVDGLAEQESYSLPPENFHLPAIAFTDSELAALQTALSLLDGEFAYAEPLRLALQQISWGRPSPLRAPDQRSVALGITASAGGHDLSHRLVKIDTAISRRKTITFGYYTMERDAEGERKVDPYQLLYQGGQFYLVGHSHERDDVRVFRLSRIRGKVSYATKAEHDFQRPDDFDPRVFANRIYWQFGDPVGEAEILVADRIAWQIERHFGRYGAFRDSDDGDGRVFATSYANPRSVISWALGLGEHARVLGPPELTSELEERVALLVDRHGGESEVDVPDERPATGAATAAARAPAQGNGRSEAAIRPERFARLVTLASILIEAGREGWYVASFDPARDDVRHFRLDRIKSATVTDERYEPRPEVDAAADIDGWPRTGEVEASRRARVWVSPERARWAREERTVVGELGDGAVVVELSFAGTDWLVREVLKEAGDAAVLDPPEAREAVLAAAERLSGVYA